MPTRSEKRCLCSRIILCWTTARFSVCLEKWRTAKLAVALKNANEEVQNVIFNNMSTRLVDMIKEDMEYMGPVRLKDVEEAQQKIVKYYPQTGGFC